MGLKNLRGILLGSLALAGYAMFGRTSASLDVLSAAKPAVALPMARLYRSMPPNHRAGGSRAHRRWRRARASGRQ